MRTPQSLLCPILWVFVIGDLPQHHDGFGVSWVSSSTFEPDSTQNRLAIPIQRTNELCAAMAAITAHHVGMDLTLAEDDKSELGRDNEAEKSKVRVQNETTMAGGIVL